MMLLKLIDLFQMKHLQISDYNKNESAEFHVGKF